MAQGIEQLESEYEGKFRTSQDLLWRLRRGSQDIPVMERKVPKRSKEISKRSSDTTDARCWWNW